MIFLFYRHFTARIISLFMCCCCLYPFFHTRMIICIYFSIFTMADIANRFLRAGCFSAFMNTIVSAYCAVSILPDMICYISYLCTTTVIFFLMSFFLSVPIPVLHCGLQDLKYHIQHYNPCRRLSFYMLLLHLHSFLFLLLYSLLLYICGYVCRYHLTSIHHMNVLPLLCCNNLTTFTNYRCCTVTIICTTMFCLCCCYRTAVILAHFPMISIVFVHVSLNL